LIVKLLDTNDPSTHVKEAAFTFQIEPLPLPKVIAAYASDPCEWIRQCAEYAAINLFYVSKDSCWLDGIAEAKKTFA
jgi:hypothetical protein